MVETIIKWNMKGLYKADATRCFEEIQQIGDEVKPKQILDKARNPQTELHKCFDWDDTSAAEKYRIEQAKHIVRSLIVVHRNVDDAESTPIQFRVMMKNDRSFDSGYKQTIVMVKDEDEYKKLLEQAYSELHSFKQKYSCLTELAEILALID